jgi:hypothetical protein
VRFDQPTAYTQLQPQSLPRRRQHVRERDVTSLDSECEHLGVDAIGFLAVIPNTELPRTARVDEQHVMSPPELAARGGSQPATKA